MITYHRHDTVARLAGALPHEACGTKTHIARSPAPPRPGKALSNAAPPEDFETRTMSKVTWRLVPFLMLCYFIAYLDRVNVGFGGATMRTDLDLSATAFGGAAGIFFVAYFFFEVPSNLALNAFGARRWIARIMFTWGIISGLQAFITRGVELLRHPSAARRRRSRLLPGDHLLSDALVSDRLSRPHRRLVHVRDTDLDRYRGADLRPDARP